jgi:hypothetical protein
MQKDRDATGGGADTRSDEREGHRAARDVAAVHIDRATDGDTRQKRHCRRSRTHASDRHR